MTDSKNRQAQQALPACTLSHDVRSNGCNSEAAFRSGSNRENGHQYSGNVKR